MMILGEIANLFGGDIVLISKKMTEVFTLPAYLLRFSLSEVESFKGSNGIYFCRINEKDFENIKNCYSNIQYEAI